MSITGYRDLSEEEKSLINEIKAHAEATRALLERVGAQRGTDDRWAAIARTDLQKGYMFLVRAVARPTTF